MNAFLPPIRITDEDSSWIGRIQVSLLIFLLILAWSVWFRISFQCCTVCCGTAGLYAAQFVVAPQVCMDKILSSLKLEWYPWSLSRESKIWRFINWATLYASYVVIYLSGSYINCTNLIRTSIAQASRYHFFKVQGKTSTLQIFFGPRSGLAVAAIECKQQW